MATILEEKLKEKEKQLKLAKVAKRMDKLTKAVKHLVERTEDASQSKDSRGNGALDNRT